MSLRGCLVVLSVVAGDGGGRCGSGLLGGGCWIGNGPMKGESSLRARFDREREAGRAGMGGSCGMEERSPGFEAAPKGEGGTGTGDDSGARLGC